MSTVELSPSTQPASCPASADGDAIHHHDTEHYAGLDDHVPSASGCSVVAILLAARTRLGSGSPSFLPTLCSTALVTSRLESKKYEIVMTKLFEQSHIKLR